MDYIQATCPLMRRGVRKVESNPVNTEIEGAIESFHIKQVEFRENVRAFFPQGQSKLSAIIKRVSVGRGLTVYKFPAQIHFYSLG